MKKSPKTRASLLSSVISLTLCFAMLLGTTFAWFTDTATTGVNKIQAGNLDVDLKYAKPAEGAALGEAEWVTVQDKDDLFDKDALWEPGHVEVAYLKVENLGSLALDYSLRVFAAAEKQGINKGGDTFSLSQYLKFGVVPDVTTAYTDRIKAVADVKEPQSLNVNDFKLTGEKLLKEETKVVALVVWMPESVGNEANGKEGSDPATIDLKVILEATQATFEKDSFNENYDQNADGMPDHPEFGEPIGSVTTVPGAIPAKKDETTNKTIVSSEKDVTAGGIEVTYPVGAKIDTEVAGEPTVENNNTVNAVQGLVPTGTESKFSNSITLEADETLSVYELMLPVAQDNTVLIKIIKTIDPVLEITGLYHNGTPLKDEKPDKNATAEGDNGYYTYNPSDGTLTIWVNHASEVTLKLKGLFDGGTGTEEDPYQVSTAKQFASMGSVASGKYYVLANNIELNADEAKGKNGAWVSSLRNCVIDGNGHTITAKVNDDGIHPVFYSLTNSTVKNLKLDVNNAILSCNANKTTFENVTISGKRAVSGNYGMFALYAKGDLTFNNCVSETEMTGTGTSADYNAIFVGCALPSYPYHLTLSFKNCENRGALVCGKAAMFLGNASQAKKVIFNIENCTNSGAIRAVCVENGYTPNWYMSAGYQSSAVNGTEYTATTLPNFLSDSTITSTGTVANGPAEISTELT